jgi:hypothetical protein
LNAYRIYSRRRIVEQISKIVDEKLHFFTRICSKKFQIMFDSILHTQPKQKETTLLDNAFKIPPLSGPTQTLKT